MTKRKPSAAHPHMLPVQHELTGVIAGEKLTLNPSPDELTNKQPISKPAK